MKYFSLILMLFFVEINAKTIQQYVQDYKQEKYDLVCLEGYTEFQNGNQDEKFLAIVGTACANTDNLNPVGAILTKMNFTPDARATSAYFALLELQKKLIYQFMLDDISLNTLKFPHSPHILSYVFDHLASGKFIYKSHNPKMIEIDDGNKHIIISIVNDQPNKVMVDEYNGKTLIKRHWYR